MAPKRSHIALHLIGLLMALTGAFFCPCPNAQAIQCRNIFKSENQLSNIFSKSGIKYLSHQTDAKSLIGILKNKALLSRKELTIQGYRIQGNRISGMNREVVYVTALQKDPLKNPYFLRQLMNDEVMIFFLPQVIERNRILFINDGWRAGKNDHHSTIQVSEINQTKLQHLSDSNEVIFSRLDFELHEVRIVVSIQAYDRLKRKLKSDIPAEVNWEEILIPFDMNFDD